MYPRDDKIYDRLSFCPLVLLRDYGTWSLSLSEEYRLGFRKQGAEENI
jgi:hypothetical protein